MFELVPQIRNRRAHDCKAMLALFPLRIYRPCRVPEACITQRAKHVRDSPRLCDDRRTRAALDDDHLGRPLTMERRLARFVGARVFLEDRVSVDAAKSECVDA